MPAWIDAIHLQRQRTAHRPAALARGPAPVGLLVTGLALMAIGYASPPGLATAPDPDRSTTGSVEDVASAEDTAGHPDAEAAPTAAPDPPEYRESDEPPVHLYQGAYWALQAHVGLLARMRPKTSESPGPLIGASARLATLMSLLDLQAHFLGGWYEATSRTGTPVSVGRYSLGLEARLHPFLITILSNSTFFYWLAGLYGSGGADLDITTLKPRRGEQLVDVNIGWTIGGGSDFPVTDPNEGWGLWVGVQYKMKFLGVRSRDLSLGAFDEHIFMVTVAYRNNDIYFFRVPRPDEVRHRDGDVGHF